MLPPMSRRPLGLDSKLDRVTCQHRTSEPSRVIERCLKVYAYCIPVTIVDYNVRPNRVIELARERCSYASKPVRRKLGV